MRSSTSFRYPYGPMVRRLCWFIDLFRGKYGHWPTRVRLDRAVIETLNKELYPDSLKILQSRLELIATRSMVGMEAEDDLGNALRSSDSENRALECPSRRCSEFLNL